MRFHELFEMSYAEAKAVWLKHGIDPEKISKEDLGKTRNRLMKLAHPDAGGNVEDAKLINAAYDVLKNPKASSSPAWGSDDGGYYEERPRRERNWYYSPGENERHDRDRENSNTKWSWAGYSGGMHDRAEIYRHDYTDVNFIKKRMWELSGESTEEWTIWGFDGSYTRGVTVVYGSPQIFAQMAEAMITWQTQGGNPYECRAVIVERHEKYRSKPFRDDDDDKERTVYLIWADGVFYDKKPIPITYTTFNANPGNDRSFNRRLRKLIDDLQEQGGRAHEQDSMHTPGGSEGSAATFETGAYVVHPKYDVGRVVNPEVRKGLIRVTFKKHGKMQTGNVKASSLRAATKQERWQFEHGE